MNPKNELIRLFNRSQNHNFNFESDLNDIDFAKIQKSIQKEIDKNLLKRPGTTCAWLIDLHEQIVYIQKYIHKRYSLDIQEIIIKKKNRNNNNRFTT